MTEATEKNKKPRYNKMRLVYSVDPYGDVQSYVHAETQEAKRIIRIRDYLKRNPGWIPLQKVSEDLKQCHPTIWWTVRAMAGVMWADMQDEGVYQKLMKGPLIHIRKGLRNQRGNLNPKMKRLKAAIYVRFPTRI